MPWTLSSGSDVGQTLYSVDVRTRMHTITCTSASKKPG